MPATPTRGAAHTSGPGSPTSLGSARPRRHLRTIRRRRASTRLSADRCGRLPCPPRAEAFAARHGIDRAFGSPDELVALDGVDIVYIATPHTSQCQLAELALHAGKPVLMEKPLAMTRDDALAITQLGRDQGLLGPGPDRSDPRRCSDRTCSA